MSAGSEQDSRNRMAGEQYRRTPSNELSPGVCVVGMACRLPGGGTTPEAFWNILLQGKDVRTTTPTQRWNYHQASQLQNLPRGCKNSLQYGYFVEGLELFDAASFGIKPTEAEVLDPQQRMLLEVTYEALGRAGYSKESVQGSNTGVFVAVTNSDRRAMDEREDLETVTATSFRSSGGATSVCSGRLSYVFGLMGPSFSVDTACSSSLVAFHCAVNALMAGDCDMAIVGGVNAMISAHTTAMYAATGMLSPDCRCKAFDAHANGYARGEGCGVIILKRTADAQQETRPILAAVRSTAVMHHGNSDNLVQSQMRLLQTALRKGSTPGAQVDYLEAHGIGIKVADSSEIVAVAAVLLEGRPFYRPLVVGALKPAIGHLESASGVAALIKAILVLQHRQAPPNIGGGRMQSAIMQAVLGRPIEFPTTTTLLTTDDNSRLIAAVNCFGVSGTLSHVLLESVPARGARQIAGSLLYSTPLSAPQLQRQAFPWPGYNDQHELLQVTRQLGDGSFAFAAEMQIRIRQALTVTVHGMPALPVAVLLELACNAAITMLGSSSVEMRNMHLAPLCRMPVQQPAILTSDPMLAAAAAAVAAEEEPPLQTVLCRVWQKSSKLQVHTAEGPADDVLRSARLERTFCVAVADFGVVPSQSLDRLDLLALQQRCTVNLAPPVFYRQLEASGLLYQGMMRCIHRIARSGNDMEALAGLRVPSAEVVASFNLHPVLLEACIHLAYAAAWGHVPLSTAHVPVAITRLVYHKVATLQQRINLCAGVQPLHAHARIRNMQDADLIADCVIAAESGEILAEIHGLQLHPLPPAEAPAAAEVGCTIPYLTSGHSTGQTIPRMASGGLAAIYSPNASSQGNNNPMSGSNHNSAHQAQIASGSNSGFASAGGSIASALLNAQLSQDTLAQQVPDVDNQFNFNSRRSRERSSGDRSRRALDAGDFHGQGSGDQDGEEVTARRPSANFTVQPEQSWAGARLSRPSTANSATATIDTMRKFFSNSFSIKREGPLKGPSKKNEHEQLPFPRKAMERPGSTPGEASPRSVVDHARRVSPATTGGTNELGPNTAAGENDSGANNVTGLIPIFSQDPQNSEGSSMAHASSAQPFGAPPPMPASAPQHNWLQPPAGAQPLAGAATVPGGRTYSLPTNVPPPGMTSGRGQEEEAQGFVPHYGSERQSNSTLHRLRNLIMGFDDEGDVVPRRPSVNGVHPLDLQQQLLQQATNVRTVRTLDVMQQDQDVRALLAAQTAAAQQARPMTAPVHMQRPGTAPAPLPPPTLDGPAGRSKLQWSQLDAVPETGESTMLLREASPVRTPPPKTHSDGSNTRQHHGAADLMDQAQSHPIDLGLHAMLGSSGSTDADTMSGMGRSRSMPPGMMPPQMLPMMHQEQTKPSLAMLEQVRSAAGLPPLPRYTAQPESGVQDWPVRPSTRGGLDAVSAPTAADWSSSRPVSSPAPTARPLASVPDTRYYAATQYGDAHNSQSRSASTAGHERGAPQAEPAPQAPQWSVAPAITRLPTSPRRVIFLFDGSFTNLHLASVDWYRRDEVFRQALEACSACMQGVLPESLPQVLYNNGEEHAAELQSNLATAHVAAFAVGYATARSLMAAGITPDVMIGYGIGEYLAAHLAGVMTLRDALLLLVARARLVESLPRSGAMVSVRASPATVAAAIENLGESIGGAVSVAAVNTPQEVVLSGLRIAVDKLMMSLGLTPEVLEEGDTGAAGRPLHSPLMEAVSRPLRLHLEGVQLNPAQLPFISTVTGCFAGSDVAAREHWVRQMVAPVQFLAAMRTVQRMGPGLLLQVGPGHRLLQHAQSCLGPSDASSCLMLPSLAAGAGSYDAALSGIQQCLASGQ